MASANPDKSHEIVSIVRSVVGDRVEIVPRPDSVPDVDETGETLEENARLKAHALLDATGVAAMADDTGLEVDALGGAPGVRSARYSGENATYEQNVAKLLYELGNAGAASAGERRGRFTTVALVVFPDGTEMVATGKTEGTIATEPRGEAGFGYDPVFVPDQAGSAPDQARFAPDHPGGRTYAEMTPQEKHACSHRGKAFRALATGLLRRVEGTDHEL